MDKRFWAAAGRVGNKTTAPSTPHFYIVRGPRVTNRNIAPALLFYHGAGFLLHSLHYLSSRRCIEQALRVW